MSEPHASKTIRMPSSLDVSSSRRVTQDQPGAPTRSRPLRIAILSTHLRGGGKETFVVHLANTLAAMGHAPRVVCFDAAGKGRSALRDDVPVVEFGRSGNDPRLVLALSRFLRREQVDVVHSNNWGTLVEAVLATWPLGTPVVHTQHGLDYETGASRQRRSHGVRGVVLRAATRRLHSVVAVSPEVGEMLRTEWRIPAARVHVITNGVPMSEVQPDAEARAEQRRRLGLADDDHAIVCVAYLRPVKNFPILVRAVASLPRALRVRLFIVGVGPAEADIRQTVAACDAEDRVTFLGSRLDVPEILPLFDTFALASESEGISISILEAMAAGLPVVTTRVGGNPLLVEDGHTGLLVPAGDVAALSSALERFALSADLRDRMGTAARERGRHRFSIERMTHDYLRVFESTRRQEATRV